MTFFFGKRLIGFINPVNAHIHSFLAASDHIKELIQNQLTKSFPL